MCVDDFPEVGEVKVIVIDNERGMASVVCVLQTEYFNHHHHSCEVTDYEEFRLVNQDQFLAFHHLCLHNLSI